MNKFALLGLAALGAAAAAVATPIPADAFVGTCKNVHLGALNHTGGTVKIIDVDYTITGVGKKSEPIRNQQIPQGRHWGAERNLERAAGRATVVTVKYRKRKDGGFGKWSKVHRADSARITCSEGSSYTVTLR
jgi:hypothetical protein